MNFMFVIFNNKINYKYSAINDNILNILWVNTLQSIMVNEWSLAIIYEDSISVIHTLKHTVGYSYCQ